MQEEEGRAVLANFMLFGTLTILAVAPVLAQSNNAISIIGTVEKVDATSISLKDDGAASVESFKLAPDFLVLQNKAATLADIKPNDLSPRRP
jgi:hypothetical protein